MSDEEILALIPKDDFRLPDGRSLDPATFIAEAREKRPGSGISRSTAKLAQSRAKRGTRVAKVGKWQHPWYGARGLMNVAWTVRDYLGC